MKRESVALFFGIDLDNTLICYDRVFTKLAIEANLIAPSFTGTKTDVREWVRALPNGELAWRRLQAQAYGPQIRRASPATGALRFIRDMRRRGARLAIVSHKTEFSNLDDQTVNLRDAARGWLLTHGVVGPHAVRNEDVYFESSREQKIARLTALGCTHFIDDLEEVLTDPAFPNHVEPLLLTSPRRASEATCRAYTSFHEIAAAFAD